MPNQFQNVTINGDTVSVIFPSSFKLPPTVTLNKISDHELGATVLVIVKKMFGLVTVKQQFTVYYNADTGTFKVTLT